MHITSLPSRFGIGDLGPDAYRFVDACAQADQHFWQVLPVGPVAFSHSPYASPSTFAGNPLLISPDHLVSDGLLLQSDLTHVPEFEDNIVDFERAIPFKRRLLQAAWARYRAHAPPSIRTAFDTFRHDHAHWVDNYALFAALRESLGERRFAEWPRSLALRNPNALRTAHKRHKDTVVQQTFWQFLFQRQWDRLREYCRNNGVSVVGDLPMYVAHDSADVWSHPDLFRLDDAAEPTVVAGVPPDFFSATGQLWGNPVYRWDQMANEGYAWWTARIKRALALFDLIRLDHFRGFVAFWAVPAGAETAEGGQWVDGAGAALFKRLTESVGTLPVIAENLGIITDDVTALMRRFDIPGMRVLQFAFGHNSSNEHLPHQYTPRVVAYTGTHDNNTLSGWWDYDTTESERDFATRYLHLDGRESLQWRSIRVLMASRAGLVIFPVQDLLELPATARMNTPGTIGGNWAWRLRPGELDRLCGDVGIRLRDLTRLYGRAAYRSPL